MIPASPDQVQQRSAVTLEQAPVGRPFVLDRVQAPPAPGEADVDDLATTLAAEGIVPGVAVTPERRMPFGGPIVVRVGRARVALGRSVARRLVVVPATQDGLRDPGR